MIPNIILDDNINLEFQQQLVHSKIYFVQDYVMTMLKNGTNVNLSDLVKQALEAWKLMVA